MQKKIHRMVKLEKGMQRSILENQFLTSGEGFAGVALGYSPQTAHGRGYSKILGQFGIDAERLADDAEALCASEMPGALRLLDVGGLTTLSLLPGMDDSDARRFVADLASTTSPVDGELVSWWEGDSFVLAAVGSGAEHLKELADAFSQRNISLGMVSGSGAAGYAYPVFVTRDAVDPSWRSIMLGTGIQ